MNDGLSLVARTWRGIVDVHAVNFVDSVSVSQSVSVLSVSFELTWSVMVDACSEMNVVVR